MKKRVYVVYAPNDAYIMKTTEDYFEALKFSQDNGLILRTKFRYCFKDYLIAVIMFSIGSLLVTLLYW